MTGADGGLNSFKPFEQNKNLREFNYNGASTSDVSESSLGNIPTLQTINYYRYSGNNPSFGDLDHLPNLKSLTLNSTGLQDISSLKEANNLETLDLEDNNIAKIPDLSGKFPQLTTLNLKSNDLREAAGITILTNLTDLNIGTNKLTEIPDFSNLSKLKVLNVSVNNISIYKNLDKLNQLETPPSVDMSRNILTNNEGLLTYKGNLNVQFNFIAGFDLYKQIRMKSMSDQSVGMNMALTLPI